MNVLLVAVGGALGATLRYLLDFWVTSAVGTGFPWGTFIINVSGCFMIGFVLDLVERGALSARARLFLAVGVFGGYTTFSIFSYESLQLLSGGAVVGYVLNAFGQLALGLVAVYLGVVTARRLGGA